MDRISSRSHYPIGCSTRPPHAPTSGFHIHPPRGSQSNGDHTPFPSYINPSSFLFLIIITISYNKSQAAQHYPLLHFPTMASNALSSFTAANPALSPKPLLPHGSASPSVSLGFSRKVGGGRAVVVAAATVDTNNMPMTGVVFQPFEEVKKADLAIPITSHASLARQRFADASEAVINEQIK